MTYKEFESDKIYIVEHSTGYGVMESPLEVQGIMLETNDKEEAERVAKTLYEQYLTPGEKESSWINNHFQVAINTSTVEGNTLLEEWRKGFKKNWNEAMKGGRFTEYVVNGNRVLLEKDDLYDN